MPPVVRVRARAVSPVGYEWGDVCELLEDVEAGDLLEFTGVMNDGMSVMRKLPAGANAEADGVSLKKQVAGYRGHDYGIHYEVDGFSAGVPGTPVYPAGAGGVNGGLDTTANGRPIGKFVTPTRIRFQIL